jgi:site-specific recombinase
MHAKRRIKMARYVEHNLGAIMGNVLLGFGLGFLVFFGKILGLPLDIRHVTISTGFFGFSLFSSGFQIGMGKWVWCIAGLAGIAFTNLFVSFSLALFTALKSRGVSSKQLLPLAKLTLKYFLKFPLYFFYPPKEDRPLSVPTQGNVNAE